MQSKPTQNSNWSKAPYQVGDMVITSATGRIARIGKVLPADVGMPEYTLIVMRSGYREWQHGCNHYDLIPFSSEHAYAMLGGLKRVEVHEESEGPTGKSDMVDFTGVEVSAA